MRMVVAALLLALSAVPSIAQPIRGHSQKAAYASPTEWPFLSAQCHWKVAGVLAHTHVELKAPIYGEVTADRLALPLTVKLFHTAGRITYIGSPLGWVRWNVIKPVEAQYPNIQGDPNGVVTVTGIFEINPAKGDGTREGPTGFNAHGWTSVELTAETTFPDGSRTQTAIKVPFYSVKNPAASVYEPPPDAKLVIRSQCAPTSLDPNFNAWGAHLVEFQNYIPIAPLALGEVWNPTMIAYSYAATQSLEVLGRKDRRLDPDLHNGISGTQITSPFTFDTTVSGVGPHKFSFLWDTTVGDTPPAGIRPNQEATALLVVDVQVGEGAPPPPPPPVEVCGDGLDNDGDGLVDEGCAPPPPPPPTWSTFGATFQNLGTRIRVCNGTPLADGTNCVELSTIQ